MADFFPRRSLAHDEVDRYTTWAFLLFLFMALVTLLMPLSPMLNSNTPLSTTAAAPATSQLMASPAKVKATCWCPAQFEKSQVDYTTTFCSGVANGILNGVKPNGTFGEYSDLAGPPDAVPAGLNEAARNTSSFESTLNKFFETRDQHNAQQAENERIRKRTRELVDFRTPTILVVLALCLKLPYMFASLARSLMTSGVNIDQALDNCVASRSLDIASQRQIHEETASAVADSLKKSKSSASSLLLFTKVLILVVLLAETVFVGKSVLTDIQDMEMGFEETPVTGSAKSVEKMEKASKNLFAYPNNIFHCSFYIRQLSNVHDYIVQCIVTYVDDSNAAYSDSSTARVLPQTDSSTMKILLLYQALYTIVLSVLAFLLIAGILNTVTWFLRLFVNSYATSVGLPSNAARDVILLVHMARLNAGAIVARGLAGSSAWSNRLEETDKEPTMESKA